MESHATFLVSKPVAGRLVKSFGRQSSEPTMTQKAAPALSDSRAPA